MKAELESVGLVELLKDFAKRNAMMTFFKVNYWLQFTEQMEDQDSK